MRITRCITLSYGDGAANYCIFCSYDNHKIDKTKEQAYVKSVIAYTSNNIVRLESKLCLLLVLFYFSYFSLLTVACWLLGASLCMSFLVCKV